MPQKSKKTKKKDGGKRKQDNEVDKNEKSKNTGKGPTNKSLEILSTHFSNEELQEIKNILKNKELTNVSLILAAVILNKCDFIKRLVQKGCNLNEAGPNRITALMWAVKCKNLEVIEFLLSNGADPTIKNNNGDSVLFMALENKLWDEKSYIKLWNHIKNVSFVDVDFKSKNGRNMVHAAIRREWSETLEMLISGNANVNAGNSNGMTPLMLASYFNNLNLVKVLLQANAYVLKEDANGCTALCYAISYVINKNAQVPHLVVDQLITALRANEMTFKDFFKTRINLILNDTVTRNKSGQPVPDTKVFIIPYLLRYIEGALKTLLEVNIFRRIAEATAKYIREPFQMMKYLTIINEVLKYCERYFGTGVVEKQLLETFITNGGADTCLSILKMYGFDNTYKYDFISSAFLPLVTVCASQTEGRSWLYNNCLHVLPYHAKFLTLHPIENSDDFQTKQSNEKILKINDLIENIKKERAFYHNENLSSENNIKPSESTENNQNSQKMKEAQKGDRSVKDAKQEPKPNQKKTRRRAKALKAKISKIKSADLTERLNQNGKKILEQKCASDTSIIKKDIKTRKTEVTNSTRDARSAQWQQHCAWEQVWFIDSGNHPAVQDFNKTVSMLENQIAADVKDHMFNTDIEPKIEKQTPQNREIVSLYPDWKNKNLIAPITSVTNFINDLTSYKTEKEEWSKFTEFHEQEDDANSKTNLTQEEIKEMLNYTLNYLSGLLRRIIVTYQNHWDHDRERERAYKNDHGDVTNQYEKASDVKSAIEKLEIEHIEHVETEFDKLIMCIKNNADNHFAECSKIMEKLESLLLIHKIRGKSIMHDTPMQLININVDFDETFGNVCEADQEVVVPKCMENLLSKTLSGNDVNEDNHFAECSKIMEKLESLLLIHKIREKSIMHDTPMQLININVDFDETFGNVCETDQEVLVPKCMENLLSKTLSGNDVNEDTISFNYPSTENLEATLYEHPDALYLQEVLALPPKEPPNPGKVKRDKIKTMINAYHLIPSIITLCDENDEEIITKQEKSLTTVSTSKYRKRQTLQETLLAMPKVDDTNKLLEALETQGNSECQSPLENMPSRWCTIIRSLQMINDYQVLLNGDIRISSKEKDDPHTISSGGNFSPVVLGLDVNDRPLAVKRIRKDSSVCKIMKNLLNPLLGLRNTNLLHYFSCNYEENDLVLATPLCEYNMGEYVMLMKQSSAMHLRSIDIVKQFLAGLRFLHDRMEPVIHGNLKPSNIFIDLNGTVRIAEFGMHKALYTLTEAPNTSVIWFSRETFTTFKETSCIICTCASDIQVAGMLIHFMLTSGKHPYGETMQDILKNLERAIPQLITIDVDLHDLISWMLLYEPSERPMINQVLSHVFFWTIDRKWRFILACAGVSPHGTPLNISLNELHLYINIVAARENIKGRWIAITKRRFPNLTYSKDEQDSITGLLRFVRNCMQNHVALQIKADHEFRNFILSSFPALPLSLYRILESSQWLNHRVLQPFTTVDSLSA